MVLKCFSTNLKSIFDLTAADYRLEPRATHSVDVVSRNYFWDADSECRVARNVRSITGRLQHKSVLVRQGFSTSITYLSH